MRHPDDLRGRYLWLYLLDRPGGFGWRRVRVRRVTTTKKNEIRHISVSRYSPLTDRYDERPIRLDTAREALRSNIEWRGRLVPILDWLKNH